MINFNEVTTALYEQIRAYTKSLEGKYYVSKGEYVNMDPDQTPWVGVYKGEITQRPGSLGRNNRSWQWSGQAIIVVQASHGNSGEQCDQRLCEYEKNVLDAIWSNPQLGGKIDHITNIKTSYSYNEKESGTMYYQMATITLTLEAQTG